jgi:hypothetical protein
MRDWKISLLVLLVGVSLICWLVADARASEARTTKCLATDVARLEARLGEARHVLRATRYYSTHDYSDFAGRHVQPRPVGRWVWLARDTGWKWDDIDMLMHIIARESSGYPEVPNGQGSGAMGLLQWMPQWYNGAWHEPFDPTNPRASLSVGVEVHASQGWGPWAL